MQLMLLKKPLFLNKTFISRLHCCSMDLIFAWFSKCGELLFLLALKKSYFFKLFPFDWNSNVFQLPKVAKTQGWSSGVPFNFKNYYYGENLKLWESVFVNFGYACFALYIHHSHLPLNGPSRRCWLTPVQAVSGSPNCETWRRNWSPELSKILLSQVS